MNGTHLLRLDEVGDIAEAVNATSVEPRARTVDASPRHESKVKLAPVARLTRMATDKAVNHREHVSDKLWFGLDARTRTNGSAQQSRQRDDGVLLRL